MTRRGRVALKVAVWAGCLAPLAALLWRVATDDLTANPISFITNWLGDWTLRVLLASLATTPLRVLFRWSWPVTLRWLLGLLVALHVLAAVVVGVTTDWAEPGFTTGDSLQYKELSGNDGLPYRDYEVAFQIGRAHV